MYVHLPSLLHFSTEIIPDPPPILNPRILEINRHVAEEGGGGGESLILDKLK